MEWTARAGTAPNLERQAGPLPDLRGSHVLAHEKYVLPAPAPGTSRDAEPAWLQEAPCPTSAGQPPGSA